MPSLANAAQITVTVTDAAGMYVNNAVIAMFDGSDANAGAKVGVRGGPTQLVALDQLNKQFVPHVLAIQVGTSLTFPNSDNIRHQVYSFSDAKRFELKLYSGTSAPPVLFDVPGVVVLGCNIHDWMSAYLYVLNTPYFAMTDTAGYAALDVPAGHYTLRIWHPRYQRGREPLVSAFDVGLNREQIHQALSLTAVDDSSGLPPT